MEDFELSLCQRCGCMTKNIGHNETCGKCKRTKRICDICKKPMFNSWAGEWKNKKYIYIHNKCKTEIIGQVKV